MAGARRWQKFHKRVMSVRRNGARHTCMLSMAVACSHIDNSRTYTQMVNNKMGFAKSIFEC